MIQTKCSFCMFPHCVNICLHYVYTYVYIMCTPMFTPSIHICLHHVQTYVYTMCTPLFTLCLQLSLHHFYTYVYTYVYTMCTPCLYLCLYNAYTMFTPMQSKAINIQSFGHKTFILSQIKNLFKKSFNLLNVIQTT